MTDSTAAIDDLEEYREIARKIIGTPECAAIIGLISQVEHERRRAEAADAKLAAAEWATGTYQELFLRAEAAEVEAQDYAEIIAKAELPIMEERDKLRERVAELKELLREFYDAVALGPLYAAAKYGPDFDIDANLQDVAESVLAALEKENGT